MQSAQYSGDDLLPIGQAAKLLGVSTDTLRRWDAAGRICALRTPTGQRRFRYGDITTLMTSKAAS